MKFFTNFLQVFLPEFLPKFHLQFLEEIFEFSVSFLSCKFLPGFLQEFHSGYFQTVLAGFPLLPVLVLGCLSEFFLDFLLVYLIVPLTKCGIEFDKHVYNMRANKHFS